MPIVYVCRPERSIVVTLWRGAVDLPQWEEHLTRMLNDKDFPRTRSHLVDLRSAEIAAGIGPAEFQRIIDLLAPHYKSIAGRRVAILAGRELPRAGILSYAIQTLEITLASFLFTNEACAWLGVSQADISKDLHYLRELAGEEASGSKASPAPDRTS